ncbi:MAG: nucleoside 2-deoxyribosyltransferase [Planctomycetota bacterium]
MPRCYLAAPLFTDAERAWNAALAADIRQALPHLDLLVPQEFCAPLQTSEGAADFGRIYAACRELLESADVVVAILDGPDSVSGTAWELGFAVARDKVCLGLRTDWRPAEDGASNCMLSRSCRRICRSGDELLEELRAHLA